MLHDKPAVLCSCIPILYIELEERKTIFIEFPIFRQIATSWSEIHLLCQKEVAWSFFQGKMPRKQYTVNSSSLLVVQSSRGIMQPLFGSHQNVAVDLIRIRILCMQQPLASVKPAFTEARGYFHASSFISDSTYHLNCKYIDQNCCRIAQQCNK